MERKTTQVLLNQMIEQQLVARGINDLRVIDAFSKVKRHQFVDSHLREYAYEDYPLDIGLNQTISQPYIVALMLESLNIKSTDRVLEIGTGSGYQTAIIAQLAAEVYTVELKEPLQIKAKLTLDQLGYKNIIYHIGNGYLGYLVGVPYDKIIVSAAAPYLPNKLIDQLVEFGRMVIPIDFGIWQELIVITKEQSKIKRERLCFCRFVPLVEE
jgi:protein-L-isoaspartate(D-aspartate) O-methyltransferase